MKTIKDLVNEYPDEWPSDHDYCFTTSDEWSGCDDLSGKFRFTGSHGDHSSGRLHIDNESWVLVCSREEYEQYKLNQLSGDSVNQPKHYTEHPSGIECIQITEHMSFNLGNALKYIWRCDLKHDAIEDLKKAKWYIEREIARRENEK